jgi:hypothetical protein
MGRITTVMCKGECGEETQCEYHQWFTTQSSVVKRRAFNIHEPRISRAARLDFNKRLAIYAKLRDAPCIEVAKRLKADEHIDSVGDSRAGTGTSSHGCRNTGGRPELKNNDLSMFPFLVKAKQCVQGLDTFVSSPRQSIMLKIGMRRLIRMLTLVQILDHAPFADGRFAPNDMMLERLIASHMALVVGRHVLKDEKTSLFGMLSPGLSGLQNVALLTNRQNGKTTLLAKLIALLIILSPTGGNLLCVYSTNLDRAIEVVKKAKDFVFYYLDQVKSGNHVGGINIVTNNERSFAVQTPDHVTNLVIARPRNPNSCRGDAMAAAIFDEIGFVSADFFYQFAIPLLTIEHRVFTCATTPPPFGSFFNIFADNIRVNQKRGNNFFSLTDLSLVCERCEELEVAGECCHKLNLIPDWKSCLRMRKLQETIPANRRGDFDAEIRGRNQFGDEGYFTRKLLNTLRDRARLDNFLFRPMIYVGVDPPSHDISCMGLSAVVHGHHGEMIIVGGSQVSGVARCTLERLQLILTVFLQRLREKYPDVQCTPIIECNNNTVVPQGLLSVFHAVWGHDRVAMAFTKDAFKLHIQENLGVYTHDGNKMNMMMSVISLLANTQLFAAKDLVTVDGSAYSNRIAPTSPDDVLPGLCDQLVNFRDTIKGKITGKTAAGDEDDHGMAFCMAAHWSLLIIIFAVMASGGNPYHVEDHKKLPRKWMS